MPPSDRQGGIGSNQYRNVAATAGSRSDRQRLEYPTPADELEEAAFAFRPDRDAWVRAGFESATTAGPWIEVGCTPEQATGWRRGFLTAEVAAPWVEAGAPYQEAFHWNSAGLSAADWSEWTTGTFKRMDPVAWAKTRLSTEAAAEWDGRGFTPTARNEAMRDGFPDPAVLARWKSEFRDDPNAVTVDTFHLWRQAGFDPEETRPWRRAGFSAPATAARYRDAGVSPDEAGGWEATRAAQAVIIEWSSHGVSSYLYKEWMFRDFDARAAGAWTSAAFMPVEAASLRRSGFEPDSARALMDAGMSFGAALTLGAQMQASR